jgi:hypothetical protein
MRPSRQLPLPGSPEAREQGCTCPEPAPAGAGARVAAAADCPLHGRAAGARERAEETGEIDTDGDIVDHANDPELRRG